MQEETNELQPTELPPGPLLSSIHSTCSYLNSTLLSARGVPLPVSATEIALLFVPDIHFTFSMGGAPLKCSTGGLFLTSLRVVYVPGNFPGFVSFAVPIRRILSIRHSSVRIACESGQLGLVVLAGSHLLGSLFFPELKRILSVTTVDMVEDVSDEDLPLYYELV